MKGLPYFCWYAADAETDESYRSMSDAEVGFYHRCLNHTWINGSLPADAKERARALGRSKPQADKMWVRVGRRFHVDPEDSTRLIDPRQEIERAEALAKSLNGKRSAEARWEKNRKAFAMRSHSEGNARASDSDSVSSEVFSEKEKITREGFENWRLDENFIHFRESYVSSGAPSTDADWERAWRFEWKRLDFQQKTDAIAYIAQCDPAFLKYPQNYLKDREWTRKRRPEPRSKTESLLESV